MRRVEMLVSDGDRQALNATMRGTAKSLHNMFDDVEIIGLEDEYKELMYADYQIMKSSDFSGILVQGGTTLKISRQPFKLMCTPDENGLDKVEAMKHTYRKLKLSCLVMLGGNGSQKTVSILGEEGLNVVSLLRIIDNDLWGMDMTSGFQSAVDVTTSTVDYIHATTASHGRVFIVEVMGHKVGRLTLYAGLAGGADIISLPEISYDINIACDALTKRFKAGKRSSTLAVVKGVISREDTKMSKKELKEEKKNGVVHPSVTYETGVRIQEAIGSEVKITIPDHMQRGGEPCSYDRVLAIRLGTAVARLVTQEQYGYMVAVKNDGITQVSLSEAARRPKMVDLECFMVKEVKMVDISFGDE